MTTNEAHPFDATIDRINAINEYLNVQRGTPDGDGWINAAALASSDTPLRAEVMARIAKAHTTRDRHYIATSFWGAYLYQVVSAAIVSFLVSQRVPNLAPATIALHVDERGWADTVAFGSARFAALPGDPDADHPDATVLPDHGALRAYLQDQIAQHYAPPMIEVLRGKPLGKRALWAYLADECAGSMVWLGQELGHAATCAEDALALVQDASLKGPTAMLVAHHNGRHELFVDRVSCCLSYKIGDHGYCTTCPLQPVEERVRLYEAWMMKEAAKAQDTIAASDERAA